MPVRPVVLSHRFHRLHREHERPDGVRQRADSKAHRRLAKIPKSNPPLPKNVPPSSDNQFRITTGSTGTVWFSQVSLYPPTWKHRPNGNRPDLMQLLADMHPAFLRFPGGNYLEGNTLETRFNWKKTIGDISQRPGHRDDAWGYWSTDGLGLLEFLDWCEDLDMEPLLAVYAGYSLEAARRQARSRTLSRSCRTDSMKLNTSPATRAPGGALNAPRTAIPHPSPFAT